MIRRVFLMLALLAGAAQAGPVRLKDLVDFDGVRGNDWSGMAWSSA